MPYQSDFFLGENAGNNAFVYDLRSQKTIRVGALKPGALADVSVDTSHPAFFEVDEKSGEVVPYFGLKNIIATSLFGKEAFIFDNHNHAFYFWLYAHEKSLFPRESLLFHIDEHSDLREPPHYFAGDASNMRQVADYTNRVLNVGNYIKSAVALGLFDDVVRVQGESELDTHLAAGVPTRPFVLNIDLDFWSEHMDYIPQKKKDELVRILAPRAACITIATSPFFIPQDRAISVLHRLFDGHE